jgi:putative copper export protein
LIFVTITETLLYLCFCLLGGTFVFYSLHERFRPDFHVPKSWLLAASIGSGVLSFGPVLYLILVLGKDMGYWDSFVGVLFTFQVGKAWLFTLAIALLILGLIYFNQLEKDAFLSKLGLLLFIVLIAAYAKAGHAASLQPTLGFITHFFHLLSVSLWAGCLIVAAWFSKSTKRWGSYLRWFTPFAIVCVVIAIVAGFGTMMIDIAKPLDHSLSSTFYQYKQGLIMNYGQALIIKHLLIIPLVLYAFFNGFYTKRLLRTKSLEPYQPIKWARVESIIIFFIFIATAFMGQQTPPHDVAQSIKVGEASPLFLALYSGGLTSHTALHFFMSAISLTFFALALLFFSIIVLLIVKRGSGFFTVVLSVGFLLSAYFGVMSGLR